VLDEEKILKLKENLRKRAKKKFPGNEERQERYVWGTLHNLGLIGKHKNAG
jgi:hypothetical protein